MYIALGTMLLGIAAGRLLARQISERLLSRVIFAAILFLLFLLGAQIGANANLFSELPKLGVQSLLLMLFCVAGSIILVKLLCRALARLGMTLNGKDAR